MYIIFIARGLFFQPSVPVTGIHIDFSALYYAIGIVVAIGTIIWRAYSLYAKAKEHSNDNLAIAKTYIDQALNQAISDRKVWVSEHSAEHVRMISDQRVAQGEVQNELDALAEKHDTDMHAFRKTIEAVLLEKRDLEAMMRQVTNDVTSINGKIEKISDGQATMSTALAKITERMDIIKSEHGQFHKGESA